MNFKPELAQTVMAGRKTVTRRLVNNNPRSPWSAQRCALKIGQTYAVCPGRGKHAIGRVRIVNLGQRCLGHLNVREAAREGFPSVRAFEQAWRAINGEYDPNALVWRVEFEVAEIHDCKACGHRGDDCVCWYIAEMARGEREELEEAA